MSLQVQMYEVKIGALEKEVASQKEEILTLKTMVSGIIGFNIEIFDSLQTFHYRFKSEVLELRLRMESISDMYGNLQEKMYNVDNAM